MKHPPRVTITTINPFAGLPRLLACGHEVKRSASYGAGGDHPAKSRYCVIQLTLSGSGEIRDPQGVHVVPPGHAFLALMPDPQVTWRFPRKGEEPWEFVWADFAGGDSVALVDELIARGGRVQALSVDLPAMRHLRRLAETPSGALTIAAGDGARVIYEFILALATTHDAQPQQSSGTDLARRMVEKVRTAKTIPLDVSTLARSLGVSREHLSRICRKHLGMSPHDYIQDELVNRACFLLKTTTLSNKELAAALKLSSAGHLARLFRRAMGVSPRRYREWHAAPQQA